MSSDKNSDNINLDQANTIISTLNTEIFKLKKKLNEKNEAFFITALNILYKSPTFDIIYDDYVSGKYYNNDNKHYIIKQINNCNLQMPVFKLTIGSNVFVLIDCTKVNGLSNLANLTEYLKTICYSIKHSNMFNISESFPQIYYHKEHIVITEFNNKSICDIFSNIIVQPINGDLLTNNLLTKSVDWIISFKKLKPISSVQTLTTAHNEHITALENIVSLINYKKAPYYEKIKRIINDSYLGNSRNSADVTLCHNNFQPSNIMIPDGNQCIKIINYQNCGYNLEHYDIVSLLYSPKMFIGETLIGELLEYYYEKSGYSMSYEHFISVIIKTSFVRTLKLIDTKLRKISDLNTEKLFVEINRSICHLKNIEKYLEVDISNDIEQYVHMKENIKK